MTTASLLAIATILGAALSIYGLVAAYFDAARELRSAEARVAVATRLLESAQDYQSSSDLSREEFDAEQNREYEAHSIEKPTYGNMPYLALIETRRLLSLLFAATRGNLITAGIGLIVSTLASVGSLFAA